MLQHVPNILFVSPCDCGVHTSRLSWLFTSCHIFGDKLWAISSRANQSKKRCSAKLLLLSGLSTYKCPETIWPCKSNPQKKRPTKPIFFSTLPGRAPAFLGLPTWHYVRSRTSRSDQSTASGSEWAIVGHDSKKKGLVQGKIYKNHQEFMFTPIFPTICHLNWDTNPHEKSCCVFFHFVLDQPKKQKPIRKTQVKSWESWNSHDDMRGTAENGCPPIIQHSYGKWMKMALTMALTMFLFDFPSSCSTVMFNYPLVI